MPFPTSLDPPPAVYVAGKGKPRGEPPILSSHTSEIADPPVRERPRAEMTEELQRRERAVRILGSYEMLVWYSRLYKEVGSAPLKPLTSKKELPWKKCSLLSAFNEWEEMMG